MSLHSLLKPFLGIYDGLIDAEVIEEIKYPFSTICMDASHDFTVAVTEEVRDYAQKKYGIFPDRVLILTGFFSEIVDEPENIKFDSKTRLSLLKASDGKHIAVLFLGAQIVRK